MARQRKRQIAPDEGCRAPKRKRVSKDMTSLLEGTSTAVTAAPKTAAPDGASSPHMAPGHHAPSVQHALLGRYYPRVETLRAYLLTRLPASSRLRRKKLRLVGQRNNTDTSAVEQLLSHLLDTVLVGCPAGTDTGASGGQPGEHGRQQMRITFSQDRRADESYGTVSDATEGAFSLQSEIVDFVIWLLFQRAKRRAGTASRGFGDFPEHVLCHGFQRGKPFLPDALADDAEATSSSRVRPPPPCTIPGLHASRPNQHAQTLKEMPWPQLLALLGASGESIMTDLLLDCSLFLPVDAGHDNYVQLTGKPLGDLITPNAGTPPMLSEAPTAASAPDKRSWSEIRFVRSRMLYARPSNTAKGAVHFGLKHIHVLNRYPYRTVAPATKAATEQELAVQNTASTVHIMMYIFPRQFGLHSVFTSSVDRTTTTQKFQDYTLREDEIADKIKGRPKVSVPRRLRGLPMRLVEMLRIRHRRCSYYELLQHYCPAVTPTGEVAAGSADVVQRATPVAQVSAFCQAVFKRVVPDAFWGVGDVQAANRAAFLKKIDTFLRLRRYETFSLHGLLQGLKVADVAWLAPPHLAPSGDVLGRGRGRPHLASTDLQKRRELWAEFLYYLIDSLLIPLLRTNFYITESGLHRNRIFYFRHDVWRRLAEPALASLKADMFEEVPQSSAPGKRDLTFGQVRLLPKRAALRPIMNLRRRAAVAKGAKQLASSTNAVLAPVASMLRYEMKQHPERLGASMASVNTIHTRLKAFKQSIAAKKLPLPTFYFAKVDVKAAFDTIPQDAMVALLRTLPSHSLYHIDRFVEIAAPETSRSGSAGAAALPVRQWRAEAQAYGDSAGFHDLVEGTLAAACRNTVFVDAAFRKTCEAAHLVGLAAEHIQQNLVKIGKKYYRQRRGIPQGSVLSSALCNYFYADLEATELGFLRDETEKDCLLLRLIDDFLLVTTNRTKAARFVEIMHRGHPRYGVAVNPKKTLVNFALDLEGQAVPRLPSGALFPYCGTYIHCATLNLMRDRETKNQVVFDTITVEQARMPGYHFQRKTLSYFKYQAKPMFFDTAHNTLRTTLRNLHDAFAETATKMWAYARCLPKDQRPRAALTTDTIQKLGELAFALLRAATRRKRLGYAFSVSKAQMQWIMLCAFWAVLRKRQSGYAAELAWLRDALRNLRARRDLRLPREFLQGIPS